MSTRPAPSPQALLAWYDRHHRRLPWRVGPEAQKHGEVADPYRVWLSEIMLQQTTVAAVKPYFEDFLTRFPTVVDLAEAATEEVMKAWAGLGYYSRARNLKAAAEIVAREHGGAFPDTEDGLRSLPGIGPYTAAAIAAIAFNRPATPVDGNIERVISRLFAIATPLPEAKAEIKSLAARLTPVTRPGDFAQAMMDLGATICTPKRSACALCPWEDNCAARAAGTAELYPVKAAKTERPTRRGIAYVAIRKDGAVLLRHRPAKGLLGGMTEVPGSDWIKGTGQPNDTPPLKAVWQSTGAPVVHVFTHFRLELAVRTADIAQTAPAPEGHWWSTPAELPGEALPSVVKKAIEAAVPGATKRRK